MTNSSLRTKLQNIIFSEQFCGLCFDETKEMSTDIVLEVASDDWSHQIGLGDIYSSVFKESIEDLASKIICSNCTDYLIQSYTFIQNTKFTSQLLKKYLNNLYKEILKLNNYKNFELESENICIILADENKDSYKQSKVTINDDRNELYCTVCQEKFIALQDFLNHNKAHSKTHKKGMETEKFKIMHLQTENKTFKLTEPKMSLNIKAPMIPEVLDKNKIMNKIDIDISKKSPKTEINKIVSVAEKAKVLNREEKMLCVMCLKCIEGRDHVCEFKCSKCDVPSCIHFAHLIHFRDQILTKSKATCLLCDFVCRDKEVLIEHVNIYHLNSQYKCDLCGQNYPTKLAIQTHISCTHFDCIVQKNVQTFGKKEDLKSKKKIHLQGADRIVSIKEIKLKELSCDKCQKCFDNVTLLQHHQKSHLKNVKCHKCNEDIHISKLEEHLKIHSERDLKCIKKVKPNITCEICEYVTWNSILLECHMNRYHLKIKPYICHICSKNFIGKHLLKKHIKIHTDNQSIICNFCGKKLANLSCLKNHLKLHTGEKNYECQICGEKFRSASIRSVHRVKKHSVKEASCPLCLSKFYTLVELRRHIIKIHWKKKTKFDPRELEGMENHYHLFHDGRRIRMGDEDVDFYMPC